MRDDEKVEHQALLNQIESLTAQRERLLRVMDCMPPKFLQGGYLTPEEQNKLRRVAREARMYHGQA